MIYNNKQFEGLWRASASEAVPYTHDFPAPLLVLPEFTDGSIGKGNATKIWIEFIINGNKMTVIHTDNGVGISGPEQGRLLGWTNSQSKSVQHRYGHGSKKALTKFMPEYSTAEWALTYKMTDRLHRNTAPWDEFAKMSELTELVPHTKENEHIGFQWTLNSTLDVFGDDSYKNSDKLFRAMKEILLTRYSEKYFKSAEFILSVTEGDTTIRQSSREEGKEWKTLQQMLSKEANTKYNFSLRWKRTIVHFTEFDLKKDKTKAFEESFPTYGKRSMETQRCHIAIDGRFIEPMSLAEFDGKALHNSKNGRILFLNVESTEDPDSFNDQPKPCTTKVSFDPNCENLNGIIQMIHEKMKEEDAKRKELEDAKEKKPRAPRKKKESAPVATEAEGESRDINSFFDKSASSTESILQQIVKAATKYMTEDAALEWKIQAEVEWDIKI